MPSASVSTATTVKPGDFASWRRAKVMRFPMGECGWPNSRNTSRRTKSATANLKSAFTSFCAQRGNRIHPCRAPCGEQGGTGAGERHEQRSAKINDQIERGCGVEQRREPATGGEREHDAEDEA